eukprot:3303731-Prymnesium_polylepis.1
MRAGVVEWPSHGRCTIAPPPCFWAPAACTSRVDASMLPGAHSCTSAAAAAVVGSGPSVLQLLCPLV